MCRPEVDARSMMKMMAMLAIDDGSDGTVSRPEVRSIVNGDDGHLATVSRARKRNWRCDYLGCRVDQGFEVTTPESSVREDDSGRVATSQLAVDAER